MYRVLYPLFLLLLLASQLDAQTIMVRGRVMDVDTREGVPFCNVYTNQTLAGTATDIDGYYEFSFKAGADDSLVVSAVGYDMRKRALEEVGEQELNFGLSSASLDLQEVVVLAGENPAHRIVRGIIENKKQNRIDELDSYSCEQYAKIELDLENVPDKLKNARFMKPFAFIFENIDSTSDEKPFLPMYLNESLSNIYHVKSEGRPKKVVKAQNTSAAQGNKSVVEFIKDIYTDFSVYDNWIYVLERPFTSPFANSGLLYYEYYIVDSTYIDDTWSYKLKFKPKRKKETTFYGEFWVADSSFAVQRVDMRMSPDVNINLVKRVIVHSDFERAGEHWLPKKEKLVIDFIPQKDMVGMIARKTATYKDYQINQSDADTPYKEVKERYDYQGVKERDPNFWSKVRHEPLSMSEASVYEMIDSMQNVPVYQTYERILETYFTGYFELGPVEVGPYFSLYSQNPLEGHRFRLGLGTSDNLSKKYYVNGYLAYGTKDKKFKYGGTFQWNLKRDPRTIIGGEYRKDISLSSESSEDFQEGNLFSGLFRRNLLQKLIAVEEGKLFFEKHWGKGWSNRFTILNRKLDPIGKHLSEDRGFNYGYLPDPAHTERIDTTISTTELVFKTRYAFEEIYLEGDFERVTVSSKYPIIELQYTLGSKGLLGGDYDYHKLTFNYSHFVYLNPIGWTSYKIKAGKTFGTVPFLLLEVHPGNEALFYTETAFNTMNRYEFASDAYVSLLLEHHFDGFFLNRIPLLRKLNFREVATFKAVIGSLSDANKAANQLNLFAPSDLDTYTGFRAPNKQPFLEAGIGIENILKIIRIEALWRLNYLDNPQATRFNLRMGLSFYF